MEIEKDFNPWKFMDEIPIKSSSDLSIRIDYVWVIQEIEKRIGKCPEEVKQALMDMKKEED